ncbi:MAG: amidohydrolase [Planctomycetes bacterium]|nr:amidohydrolase [Planctomycetota bacterium]
MSHATVLFALALSLTPSPDDPVWTNAKLTARSTLERLAPEMEVRSRKLWELAELALQEHQSSKLLADWLESQGFHLERNVAGMETAFVASYGSGKPVIAFLSEYDALPGLSQKVQARIEALEEGAGGHGCGHNLFGVGSAAAAIAVKQAMTTHGLKGTVRLYGTPAEEQGIGKVFMVRDGLFDDVDACLSWHPSNENAVKVQPSKALRSFEVIFHGRSAHASGAPWKGVSALDAVEAFGTGVNLLREHMPETARIHYVITEGGDAPNVIPARARLWVYVRGKDWPEQDRVFRHVEAIAKGADLMAWGEEYGDVAAGFRPMELRVFSGLYEYNPNLALGERMHGNLELVGAPHFTEEEQHFGRQLQSAFGLAAAGYSTIVLPWNPRRPPEPGGSTDVANISWVCPTIDLSVATWPILCPAHSWASTSASGHAAAFRAMSTAAQTLAATGVDLLESPGLLEPMEKEHERSCRGFAYSPAVRPEDRPSLPFHMR